MADDVSSSIQEVRELRSRGLYSDAAGNLEESIQRLGPGVRLVVELSETLFVQGFYGRTLEVLDKYLTSYDARNDLTAASGEIIRCFSRFYLTSQFKESLSQIEPIYDEFVKGPKCEVVDDATIRIETYYHKFWNLAAKCGAFDDSHVQRKALPRLQRAFDIFTQRKDFFNAQSVATTYSVCCSGPDKNSLVECLAMNDRIPALYKAHAQFLVAKTMKSDEQRKEQNNLFALALKLYKDNNHAHGVLDTELAMMCRLPFEREDSFGDERLGSLLKRYEALNYPSGLFAALVQLKDFAHGLHSVNMESLVLNELESLFPPSSSKLIWFMTRIRALGKRSLCGGDHGKVIQAGEALWKDLIDSDCIIFRHQTAGLISRAYDALKDHEMMMLWSQRAQNDPSQSNITSVPSFVTDCDLNGTEGLSQCFRRISALLNPELRDYSPEAAAEQIGDLLDQADVRIYQEPRLLVILENAIKLFKENVSHRSDIRLALVPLGKLRQAQANVFTMIASSRQDIDFESAALELLNEARDYYVKATKMGEAVMVLQHEGLLHKKIAQKLERTDDPEVRLAWQNARNIYKTALDSAIGLNLISLARDNAYEVAFCEHKHWRHEWCSPDDLLQSLLVAESFIDQERREVLILRGMAAAVAKRRLSSNEKTRNIYRMAIDVCIGAKSILDVWSWVQKSKARSLSDLLGLGIFIPLELTKRIQQNSASRQLFEDEHRLAEELAAASDTERFNIRIKLETHQKKMREHAILTELLDLRDGVPITQNDLLISDETQDQRNSKTVFVDWVATGSSLSMYIVKPGEMPIVRKLPVTIQSIDKWISNYLNTGNTISDSTSRGNPLSGLQEEDEEDEGPLRDLDILVAPLVEVSRPGDLLVLCPTGNLHAIPLHALRPGPSGNPQILIERNPIAYCASLTSFVQCCRRADSSPSAIGNKRFLAVYEWELGLENENGQRSNDDERRQIYTSTDHLAKTLKGESLCGEKVTMQSFKESLERAGLVHFFGHCDFAPKLIAEQSLCISGQKGEEEKEEGEEEEKDKERASPPARRITVKDLFDIRIKASHISLLACASTTQDFQAGDEPLGLVTAFLSAGATSVLGTLWSVQSPAARLFSERFYTYLLMMKSSQEKEEEGGNEAGGVYDLAYATRQAVLDVRQHWEFRTPYDWASFVLHGAWFFR